MVRRDMAWPPRSLKEEHGRTREDDSERLSAWTARRWTAQDLSAHRTNETIHREAVSVLGWLFDMVDYENVHGTLGRRKSQA
jgi:hypothetical protein